MTPNRRLVTELLKLLPELDRTMETLCQLHVTQLERQPMPEEVKRKQYATGNRSRQQTANPSVHVQESCQVRYEQVRKHDGNLQCSNEEDQQRIF